MKSVDHTAQTNSEPLVMDPSRIGSWRDAANQARSFPQFSLVALSIALFSTFLAVYLFLQGGTFHNRADEWYPYAATESLAKHANLGMDSALWAADTVPYPWQRFGTDGNLYPIYSPIQSAAGVPLYWLALHDRALGVGRTTLLTNGVITALTDALLFGLLVRAGYRRLASLCTVAAYALGTIALVHAKGYFSEPLTALALVTAAYGVVRWREAFDDRFVALAGFGLGVAFLNRPTYAVAAAIVGAWCLGTALRARRQWSNIVRSVAWGAAPLVGCGAVQAWLDWLRFGHVFDLGYADQSTRFTASFLVGLAGEVLSPGKGLLVYCPVLLLSIVGARRFWRRDRGLATLCLAMVVAYLVLYAPWHAWFGGSHAWGPRYLLPIVPFAAMPMVVTWEKLFDDKRPWPLGLALFVTAASIAIEVAGASFDYIPYVEQLFQDHHIVTAQEDDQLIPVYFDPGDSQPLHQFAYTAPQYSDLSWRSEAPNGGTRIDWTAVVATTSCLVLCGSIVTVVWRTKRRSLVVALTIVALVAALIGAAFVLPRYERQSAVASSPYGQLYRRLVADSVPGDGLVTVSIDATAVGFQEDASRTQHDGFVRQDAVPMTPTVRTFLERGDATQGRTWLIEEQGPDRIQDWLAAGADSRQVASAGNLKLLLFTHTVASMTPRPVDFDAAIHLLGYSIGKPVVALGSTLDVSLYWQAVAHPSRNLTVFVHLLDSSGRLVAQHDGPPRNGLAPTSSWRPGETVRDRHLTRVPDRLPLGPLVLTVGMYDASTGARATAASEGVRWPNDEAALEQIGVTGQ